MSLRLNRESVGMAAFTCTLVMMGCAPGDQREPGPLKQPTVASEKPSKQDPPKSRDNVPDQPVRPIKVSEMKFRDNTFGDKVRRIFKLAEKMARPECKHEPIKAFPEGTSPISWHTSWSTNLGDGEDALNFGQDTLNYHGPREVNYLHLGVNIDPGKASSHRDIVGTSVSARWKPAERGWSVMFFYHTFNGGVAPPGVGESFSCRWRHYGKLSEKEPKGKPPIDFNLSEDVHYSRTFVFGKDDKPFPTRYSFYVNCRDPKIDTKAVIPDKRIRELFASPESLRDYLINANALLLKRVIDTVGKDQGYAHDSNEPRYERPQQAPWEKKDGHYVSSRKLTEADKNHVIQDATEEIEARIRVVREHFQELYAVLPKAFPLLEALSDK
jgi:hypothetical protein